MPRKSKGPWWSEQRKQWIVDIRRKKYYLGTDRQEAELKWHELISNKAPPPPDPTAQRRETVLTDEQFRKILEVASDEQFRDLVTFCWETGCRPQEAFRLEARHLDHSQTRVVFAKDESKGKKKNRAIYLTPTAIEIVSRLSNTHPTGPLLRNEDGNQWHRNNVACRFRRMRKKLGFRT